MQEKIALEERKILIAVRRLETIRLLSELLRRVKVTLLFFSEMQNLDQTERTTRTHYVEN